MLLRAKDDTEEIFTPLHVPGNLHWVSVSKSNHVLCLQGREAPLKLWLTGVITSVWMSKNDEPVPSASVTIKHVLDEDVHALDVFYHKLPGELTSKCKDSFAKR